VDEDVEPDLLLEVDHPVDLGAHPLLVLGQLDLALAQLPAGGPDLVCLGIGADRGRGEARQAEPLLLGLLALLEGALAASVGVAERGHSGAHLGILGPVGVPPVLERTVVSLQFLCDRRTALGEPAGQRLHLAHLLDRERHPRAELVVEVRVAPAGLSVEVDRGVEERAAGGDDELLGPVAKPLEQVE
jgi:hypothetical protein